MTSLFALGIMSFVWMAVVAGLIALEKVVPWGRVASYGTAALLLGSVCSCSSRPIRCQG
jgi:predicted metal-binding membrane protein